MKTHADKTQENNSQSVANTDSQKRSTSNSTFQFVDNRPEAIAQRKLQEIVNNCSQVSQLRAFQEMPKKRLQTTLQFRAEGKNLDADNLENQTIPLASNAVTPEDTEKARSKIEETANNEYESGKQAKLKGESAKTQDHNYTMNSFKTRCFNDGYNDQQRVGNNAGGGAALVASGEIKSGHVDKTRKDQKDQITRLAQVYAKERFNNERNTYQDKLKQKQEQVAQLNR